MLLKIEFLLNNAVYKNSVCTSQETRYVSATEPSRLMLCGETVAVYCENHTEHTDTVRTSQETHYISATEPNRLMLFRETVAVYCENHTEHRYSSYLTKPNRLMRLRKESLFIVRTIRNTQIHSVGTMQSCILLQQVVHIMTTGV
jgi:hypothetical protein